MPESPISVLLVDDHSLVRRGFRRMLEDEPDIAVVGEASDGAEAVDKAAADQHLTATAIGPNEVTRGRVYFERDKKSHLVNVVLPIAGLVFEFPYAMKH